MNRTDRLYALVEELRRAGRRGRSSTWLAERFEVSPRTVKRDIAALQQAGVPVDGQDGRGGGYQLLTGLDLPPLSFTDSEAIAMAIALAAEPAMPFAPDGRAALTKILTAMSAAQRAEVEAVAGRVWMRSRPDDGRPPCARALDEALRLKVQVVLIYEDGEGRRSRRRVDPIAFARTSGHWYLLAWCHTRVAGRMFRVDRIRRATLTRQPAEDRDVLTTFGAPPEGAWPVHMPGG